MLLHTAGFRKTGPADVADQGMLIPRKKLVYLFYRNERWTEAWRNEQI